MTNDDSCGVYLAFKEKYATSKFTYKKWASEHYFTKLDQYTIINPRRPILNYSNKITENLPSSLNIINRAEFISEISSKFKFHKKVYNEPEIPKTVFSKIESLDELSFPVITKPEFGHSGIGIRFFKSKDDLKANSFEKRTVFSEIIDKKSEYRCYVYKGEVFTLLNRTPLNDKSKMIHSIGKEKMDFCYTKVPYLKLQDKLKVIIEKYTNLFSNIEFMALDLIEDKDGKFYIVELNSMPGLPFSTSVLLYEKIVEDCYGMSAISADFQVLLNDYKTYLNNLTITKSKNFKING